MHDIVSRLPVATGTTNLPNGVISQWTSGINESNNFSMHMIHTSYCTFEFTWWLVKPSNLFVEQTKFNTNFINTHMIIMWKTLLQKKYKNRNFYHVLICRFLSKRQYWTDNNKDYIIVLHEWHNVIGTKCIHIISYCNTPCYGNPNESH
jgi:hypothetical protein